MLDWHGLEHWAFLSLDYNPHAPTKPGHSGLFFSSDRAREGWRDEIMRTFVRVRPGRWVYMGQYQLAPAKSLTTTAWMDQKPEVRAPQVVNPTSC